jgi:3-dehydroquinate dehydratase-1
LRRRLELYREFLPGADFVDVELRSAKALAPLLAEARAAGVVVIVSDHHFRRTPPLALLRQRRREALRAGAEIVKVAGRTETPGDAAVLLELIHRAPCPMSVMGMGPLGKASRLLFARAGSVLNYGYLDQPQVSGQWSALKLAERLREVLEEA